MAGELNQIVNIVWIFYKSAPISVLLNKCEMSLLQFTEQIQSYAENSFSLRLPKNLHGLRSENVRYVCPVVQIMMMEHMTYIYFGMDQWTNTLMSCLLKKYIIARNYHCSSNVISTGTVLQFTLNCSEK